MKEKKLKNAAVVILYNPDKEVVYNIEEYRNIFYKVYCIDNSSNQNEKMLDFDNVFYIPLYRNTGIAYALNVGCKKAISDGCDIITLFDQDTFCPASTAQELTDEICKVMKSKKDVVAAPNIKYIYRDDRGKRILSEEAVYDENSGIPLWVITAGSTFSVRTYEKLGDFDEKLFIGQVDCEFCFRLKQYSGEIKILRKSYIFQELGNTKKRKFIFRTVHIPNMETIRYYFVFRNEIYLRNKWGRNYWPFKVKLYKYLGSIILFEDDKVKKLKACMKGIMDASSI